MLTILPCYSTKDKMVQTMEEHYYSLEILSNEKYLINKQFDDATLLVIKRQNLKFS